MLFGKIIITNENREEANEFLNSVEKRNAFFGRKEKDGFIILSFNADDETLYDICCDIADYIIKSQIRRDVFRYIEKEYTCFNGQEKEIIFSETLECREVKELAGRIYIFLKTENAINPISFYKFMCTDIGEAALSTADEEAEKLISLNDDRDFMDFLKYFASMSSVSVDEIDIIAEKNCLRIATAHADEKYNTEFGSLDVMAEDILSELVTLNPKKIIVHGKENYQKNEFSVIINSVFENRVFFCEGCPLCPKDTNDK